MMDAKNPGGRIVPILITLVAMFILSPLQKVSAQQLQLSTFSIPAWAPGTTPVFSGTGSNVINLRYGDSLTTLLAFTGTPTDGLGTDPDNIATQSFSYSYTLFLTRIGESFSMSTSLPIATHSISADQSCSSGTMPPWTIGYDAQPTTDANNLNMNINDEIVDCVPAGDYEVDIVVNDYAVNSVGLSAQPLQLAWSGYSDNSSTRGQILVQAPSSVNTSDIPLSPTTDFLFSKVAFIHVSAPTSCPPIRLSIPQTQTFLNTSATVTANYPGHCSGNAFSYLWSNGDTTATATNLSIGTYTVTVTTPCGNSASASVNISYITDPNASALSTTTTTQIAMAMPADHNTAATGKYKSSSTPPDVINATLYLYPNPARQHISFDFTMASAASYTVRIYDLLGNEIMAPISDVSLEAGRQHLDINIDALPNGVYLYELDADQSFKGKFIKQ